MRVLHLPNRDPRLPALYELDDHPLVDDPHGRIILMVQDCDPEAMSKVIDGALSSKIPSTMAENDAQGQSRC
jgi:hypothetical protein